MPQNPYALPPQQPANPYQTRPAPPPPAGRPTPPPPAGRPVPPPAGGPVLGNDVMEFLTRTLDTDKNGRLDGNDEPRIVGTVGNNNGINGTAETARALNAGSAAMYAFQLARDVADAVANHFTDRGVEISSVARARLDDNRDGRVSRQELSDGLVRGGLAINANQIMTSDEAKSRFATRPAPPPIDRPLPPPVTDRPMPPPVGNRPTPPSVNPYDRPTTFTRTPNEVLTRFNGQFAPLKQVYNTTSMNKQTYDAAASRMVSQAVEELIRDTKGATFAERKQALEAIYNASPMTSTQHNETERTLAQEGIQTVLSRPYGSWQEAKSALDAVYNPASGSAITSAEHNAAEAQLLTKLVDRIKYGSFPSFTDRLAALERLYSASPMTSSQHNEFSRQLVELEGTRGRY